MPNFIQLKDSKGNKISVDLGKFNQNPNAYGSYTIRMSDDEGNSFAIPATEVKEAQKNGLHVFQYSKENKKPTAPTSPTPHTTPTMSYQDLNTEGYWSMQLGNTPKQDILPTQQNPGLDLPNLGGQEGYVDRTMDVLYNEQKRFAKSQAEMERIQKELGDANKRAEAIKKKISEENQRRQDTTHIPTYSGFYAQLPQNNSYAKQLEQEQRNIAQLSKQLNENEYYQRNLRRLEEIARGLSTEGALEAQQRDAQMPWYANPYMASPSINQPIYQPNEKQRQSSTILENVKQTRRLLREASLSADSWYNKLGRGMWDAARDINTWDNGVNAVNNALSTLNAKRRFDQGKATAADKAVLESAAIRNAASQKTKDAISAFYNAGITTTNMIPFMAQIVSSPFNNVGRSASSLIGRTMDKMLTQTVQGALLQRMLPQVVSRAAVSGMKGIGRFAGDVAGGAATALTFANQKMLADAANRYQGQHTGRFTADGRFEYTGSEKAKGKYQALLEAFATQAIEYQSELVGEYFTPLNRLMAKGLGKAVGYGTKEFYDAAGNKITSRFFGLPGHKISLDRTVDLFSRLSNAEMIQAFNKFTKATKFNGVIGEYLEEVVGNMENATLGINDANWGTGEGGVFNPKENMETFLAVAVGSGFMAGLGGPIGLMHKARINRAYNRANADGIEGFGLSAWQAIRDQIDYAPVPELPNIVLNIMNGMNDKQKRVVQNYAAFSVAKQGSLMSEFKDQLEKPHVSHVGVTVEKSPEGEERYFVTSSDEQYNVLQKREFKTEEDANAYVARVDEYIKNGRNLQVLNQLLSTEEGTKTAEQIAVDMTADLPYISELFYTDPLRRSELEQKIVDMFVDRANGVAYPSTEVNEPHEVQNGQDLADGAPVGDQATIDAVNQREANAISHWNQIADPDLQDTISRFTDRGIPSNGIVEFLRYNDYSEDIISAFCELCNAKAEKDGFISRTGQRIEEQVNQRVQQATFAGQLNGEESPIILQVQDQTGAPLYIVSGNISVDEQGTLTSDGLVILRDEQGNFVQRPDTNGLVIVSTQNADEYKNQLLTQTQEEVTAQIQSSELNTPEAAPDNGAAPQPPTTPTQPTTPTTTPPADNSQQPPAVPVDEKGNKLYTQAPVESTIADITSQVGGNTESAISIIKAMAGQANANLDGARKKKDEGPKGNTPDEIIKSQIDLDNAVNTAQTEADYWNNVLNTINPIAESEKLTEPTSPTEPTQLTLKDDTTVPIEQRVIDLYGKLNDEEVRENVDARIADMEKQLNKLPQKPKMVADEEQYLKNKEQLNAQREHLQKQLDYWNNVKSYIQEQTHTTPEEVKAAQDELSGTTARLEFAKVAPEGATTPEEIAGEFIKNARIKPEDFYRETGLRAEDARKQFPFMLSNNGATIASLAEQLVQYDNDNYNGMFFHGDDMEARSQIIESLRNAASRKSLGRNMTSEEQDFVNQYEEQRENFYQEAYGMSYSDYLAFEEQEMPNIWRRISNFAPEQYDQMVAEYYESLPDEYFTTQNEQQNGTEGQQDNGLADGTTLLPQPPTDNEAGSGQRQDPAAETGNGGEGNNKNEEVPGGTQGVDIRQIAADIVANATAEIPYDTLTWNSETNKSEASSGTSRIISFADRKLIVLDIFGFKMPFYCSSGHGGKANVEAGKWYPFFGISPNGWMNKGTQDEINRYYDSDILKAICEELDRVYGDVRNDESVPKVKATGAHLDFINQSVTPAENGQSDTVERLRKNINDTIKAINERINSQYEKQGQQEDETAAAIKKDIEDFIAESTHNVQIINYDEKEFEAQISVDGKPSNIVITPPMERGETMSAEYRPTEGGYQELGDLLDEYNEGLEPKEQGLAGEHLAAIFSSVDAAIDFEKWLNQKSNPNDWENLTEEQKAAAIDADTIADENAKELAKDFLRGDNTSTIAEVFYREIVGRYMSNEEAPKKKEEKKPSKPKPSSTTSTGQAESGKPKAKPKEDKPKTETPPATDSKSDVGKALDEFKDVMARFRQAGRMDANVSLVGLSSRQIEMLGEVFRATAKLGYALIKSGTTTFENWLETMKAQVSDIIKRNSNWNDQDITELLTETWNNKYLVDGERKPLSQWAAEEALAAEQEQEDQKQEEEQAQPATVPDSSAVGQSQLPFTIQEIEGKTKEGMISLMWDKVYPLICAKHKVPFDILDENAYWFAPRMTKGYDKDSLIAACMKYMEHLNDEVQPASEKQMNYIMKLAAEDEKKLFKDITLTKTAASRVIALMQREEDMINNNYGKKEDFDEIFNELEKIARLNGANIPEARSRASEIAFVDNVIKALNNALETGEKPYASITALRKAAREAGMEVGENGETDIKLQELVEDALVRVARGIMNQARIPGQREIHKFRKETFEKIKLLYNLQPTISMRSSNRVALQQYSTPLPMAFVADMFANGKIMRMFFSALEPTAGNGMLVFGIDAKRVHVNEIDENRLENLRGQGFKEVTSQDATQPFKQDQYYDAIITNPPFGEAEAKDYDGYKISGLAPQIALNALSKMRDFGKAVIIIGGKQEFAPNGAIKNDKPFLAYLYNHYNVKGVIDMEGSLYAKQGTTFPTRMILIDGRRTDEERAKSDVYPPTIKNWLPKADSFDKLYDTVKSLMDSNEKTNGTEIVRTKDESLQPDRGVTLPGNTDKGTDSRKPVQDVAATGRGHGPNRGNGKNQKGDNTELGLFGGLLGGSGGLSDNPKDESGTGGGFGRRAGRDNGPGGKGRDNRLPVDNDVPRVQGTATRGVGLTQEQENRKLDSEKLPYRPHNGAFSLESLAPAAMVEAMDKTLKRIEEEYGNIDEFVTNELGYDSVDAMHKALAAEQVDSVAMAIYNMKKGEALIIGDQTGVGKGRQMAALIRWAHRQGKKPIFMTQKSNLFNDIYRDLKDIGSENLKPFIFNGDSDAKIVEIYENDEGDEKQKTIYRTASEEEINEALKSGKIPDDCDFVLCTYSQISTGDQTSKEYENQLSKEDGGGSKRRRSRKQNPSAKPKSDKKAILLRKLAKDNYLMLDESHTAAGESNQGFYMQTLVRDSKAVTFASATYAKRPDTMPLYALRTAMAKANIGMKKLIEAIQKGGVTLQEIMSRALTNSGQMVRRERDMEGVVTDWITIDNPETVKKARENYDKTIKAFNAIIDFQNKYIDAYINNRRESLAEVAGNAGFVKGTEKMGIDNTPFASKTYNYTKQLMLALKVDAIVDEVDKQIKAGRKPVIALDNTMGALFDKLTPGDEVTESTFAENLLRGLDSVMQYSQDSGKGGKKTSIKINPSELGSEGEAAYYELVSFIKESTKDIFISPLDEITAKLRAKGYTVGELTGRKNVVVEDNGTFRIAKRKKLSKQLLQSRFNSGKIDVVILNKTGSTGISLHASKTFADQRQRVMILAQPLPDINDYMQMIGRIDRTGQVKRGYYINLGLPVPAEQRFLMMLSTKLKSLNANTTTSQDSKDNKVEAPDMLNKYGSQVIVEYFKDHPDVYNKLDDPLNVKNKAGGLSEYKPSYDEDDARKLTGQVALLSTDEQQAFYDDVIERYNNLIKYLDDSGTNDLKITSLPLNATTLARAVSSEGNDPTGDNPFAQNAYVEKVEMDVLRKPMKASDIKTVINTINKGKEPKQAVEDIKTQYENEYKEKLDKQKRKYEAELERNKETLKKFEDKINGNEKMPEEDKKKAIEEKKLSLQQDAERKNENAIGAIEFDHERMVRDLDLFKVGSPYLIPDNLDSLAFDLASPGIFLGFKAKENGITPSSTVAVFATLDGRRRVEVKLSERGRLNNINETTNQNYDAAQEVNLNNWDSNIPNITRKTGYIMTGNILQAINDTQDENGNFTGQLISYTDSEGNIHDGVLMPDKWEPTMMVNAGKPISSVKADIESGKFVRSINGEVEIYTDRQYGMSATMLRVPKSKKLGAKYYENEDLRNAVDNRNFYQNRGKFQVAIPNGKLDEVLSVLSSLGVKVPSDVVKQLNSQQSDNRLAYSSNTNNVNNSRIIPEDVDKDVSLQIENEFDDEIDKLGLTDEEKAQLDKDISDYSNKSTIELEDIFYINNSRLGLRNEKENNISEMLWRRGSTVSPSAENVGGNIRNEKSEAESPTTANGEYSAVVSRRGGEAEGENTARGNEVQGQHNGPRDIRNSGSDRLLLHEGRRIEEKVLSKTSGTKLSSNQRRLLAAQYAISRELVYRDIRLAALKKSLGLEEGKPTSLDEIAAVFEKTNTDKEVKALFDKILAINKRLGTSVDIQASQEDGASGEAGTVRDVHYYLDGFTRTSAGNINIPVVIAHELLHQGTIGAINLVRKGKAEGVLTKEQIDAVNTIIDIYSKVKANPEKLSESKRGLANPYEFAAQMVDPRQRRALSMSPLERVIAAANELRSQGNPSLWQRIKNALKVLFGMSDLKKMDKAINTLLDTFSETVHDISMNDVDQSGWGYFIGEKGASNMDKAEEATTRLDNLNVARYFENQGKDPKTIKWATGWERGADGKWRYEIPDITIKPDNKIDNKKAETRIIGRGFSQPIAKLSDIVESKELFDAYPQLKDIDITVTDYDGHTYAIYSPTFNTITLSSLGRVFENVYAPVKNWDEINEYIKNTQPFINSLTDEELDEAYEAFDVFGPMTDEELKNDKQWQKLKKESPKIAKYVEIKNSQPEKIGGEKIGVKVKDSQEARSFISHEIQHAIQVIEGFANGASPEVMENDEISKLVFDREMKMEQMQRDLENQLKDSNKMLKRLKDEKKQIIREDDGSDESYKKIINADKKIYSLESSIEQLKDKIERVKRYETKELISLTEKIKKERYGLYKRVSGEVESRNVQSRINMTPEQRSHSLASETEDVGRQDQIFLNKYGEKMGMVSKDLFDKYPTWLSGQTTGTGQHTTQITSTVNTYKKIGEWMKSQGMNGATVLDASSGLGKGTEALKDMGFNVEDVEPYPSETRTPPTYLKYEDIKGKYDVVISNAVLNVIPDDWRADVLKNMADKVKPGGKMIINVRDAKEMARQTQKIELDSPSEILVTDKAGNIRAYQKGFTQKELADWIQSELGEGWTIETAKPSNSGISGRAVVVTRNTDTPLRYRKVTDSMQKPKKSEEEKSRMTNAATSLAESINTPIKVISADEAPIGAENSKGYYDTRTGEVTIVLDNNTSVIDVQRTVAHEIIGHKGLRGLLGANNYYKIMNAVYDNLPQDEKDKINEAARRNGWQMYTAMDEYLAEQAENMVWDAKSASLWQNVKHYLAEAFRTLGFIVKPNIKDARYWLWLSKNQLKRGNVMSNIKRNALLAKLDKLEIPKPKVEKQDYLGEPKYAFRNGNYVDSATYDAIEEKLKKKMFYWKEAFIDYMQAYQVFQNEMEKGLKNGLMDNQNALLGEYAMSSAIEQQQSDYLRMKLRPLQDIIKELQPEFGKGEEGIRNIENYLMMKHGLERNRVLFMRDWFKAEASRNIENDGQLTPEGQMIYASMARAIWYEYTNGNIDEGERDRQLKVALNEAHLQYLNDVMSQFNSIKNIELESYELSSISLAEAYKNIDDFINQHANFEADKQDKSGLTALKEYFSGNKYEDAAIIDQVQSYDDMIGGDMADKLMQAVQEVSQFALDEDYKNGLVTKEGYNRAKNMFRYYIPLRGFDETTMEDVYDYMTYSKGTGAKSLVHAKGRHSKAGSPLATAANMALNAIARGLRNQNKQRAYRLVNTWLKDNPTSVPPAIVTDLWVGQDASGNDTVFTPDITDDMTAEEIRDEIEKFNDRMRIMAELGKATEVKNQASFRHRFSSDNHKNEHIVPLMINGKAKIIIFNGNPRPAQALRGDLAPTTNKEFGLDKIMGNFNRIMAGAFTSYNPTFMATNLLRDTAFANNNIAVKENSEYYGKFLKNQAALLTKNIGLYAKLKWNYDKGIAPRNEMEKYFHEFMRNGGKTGFVNQQDIESLNKMLTQYNKQFSLPSRTLKIISYLPKLTKAANERIENVNRFAAYMTSRQMGRSVMRSISDAKEASVNFNRKGAAGNTARMPNATANMKWAANLASFTRGAYLFFNAGVQSLNLLSKNIKGHPIKSASYIVGIPMLLGAFVIPMLNQVLAELAGDGDDDPYANLPEWTRRNNICIYLGNGRFLKIPLPIELRAFYGLGDIAAGYLVNEHLKSEKNIGLDVGSQLSQILPVDFLGEGGSVAAALTPDAIKPMIQIATNTDWTGRPIYKDNQWNKYEPEYTKAFKGEFEPFVNLSKWINEISGGSDHVKGSFDGEWNNPAIWHAVIQGYGGGAAMDVIRFGNLGKKVSTGDFKIGAKDVPVFKAIFETPTEKTQYYRMLNKFYNYREENERFEHNLREYEKSASPLDHAKYLNYVNPDKPSVEIRRMGVFKNYEKKERLINKILDIPNLSENDKEALEEQKTRLKVDAVKRLDQIK